MNVLSLSSAAPAQSTAEAPVSKPAVSQAPASALPVDKVSLSSVAQKATSGDVDHDGDSH